MPTKSEILATLTRIANGGMVVSIGWHIAVALAVALALFGLTPGRRTLAVGLIAPLASVSAISLYYANPFNGAVFAAASAVLLVPALRSRPGALHWDRSVVGYLGSGMVLFGWVYPHFLVDQTWLAYAYAAPLGTLPCPTLSFVIGMTLVTRGLVEGAWTGALASLGLFYALFGVVRLGVYLDLGLLIGAVGLLVQGRLQRVESGGDSLGRHHQKAVGSK